MTLMMAVKMMKYAVMEMFDIKQVTNSTKPAICLMLLDPGVMENKSLMIEKEEIGTIQCGHVPHSFHLQVFPTEQ